MTPTVARQQRFTRHHPCPVCRGDQDAPKGTGRRCHGFLSDDGRYAMCSRDQHAGKLNVNAGGLYAHALGVACRCGITHGEVIMAPPRDDVTSLEDRIRHAMQTWASTLTAQGTIVPQYLRGRAITIDVPASIRFAVLPHGPSSRVLPCMVALVEHATLGAVAVHRTWLGPDARKANVVPNRMALGPVGGGAVRLAPASEEIAVSEGIETALAFMEATGMPTWAALSANGIAKLVLPESVRSVVIAADNDRDGMRAARSAAYRWVSNGRAVRIATPPEGQDFNDMLMGVAS